MTTTLQEVYDRFDSYICRMNADIEMAVRGLCEAERAAFLVPRLEFEEFCTFWAEVSADATARQYWHNRLAPGGYQAEQQAVEKSLGRCSRDRGAEDRYQTRKGRAA